MKKQKPPVPALQWSGCSDVGRVRQNNEDAFLGLRFTAEEVHRLGKYGRVPMGPYQFTFAVCDGMGGARAGEFASRIAVEKITLLLPRARPDVPVTETLTHLTQEIHWALAYLGASYEECAGMQTTLSLGWFTPGRMHFSHVGDSRIYHLPADGRPIQQLTEDDTHVGWLLRQGKISSWEARNHPRRNVLQKALGGDNRYVNPQTGSVPCAPGDRFLFGSDGLFEGLADERLAELLRLPPGEEEDSTARRLVKQAVENDGRDNTTALVVTVG